MSVIWRSESLPALGDTRAMLDGGGGQHQSNGAEIHSLNFIVSKDLTGIPRRAGEAD